MDGQHTSHVKAVGPIRLDLTELNDDDGITQYSSLLSHPLGLLGYAGDTGMVNQ